jgi:nucleotide-binding universal stress UspA family protein
MVRQIVVGVDGSDCSALALRWAAREARLRGAKLTVVAAWSVPWAVGAAPALPPGFMDDMEAGARAEVERLIAQLGQDAEGLEIERIVVQGDAAVRLIEFSRMAKLLVVGSRGLGGFREMLLGSVSHHCAVHAGCPVVIVRHLGSD